MKDKNLVSDGTIRDLVKSNARDLPNICFEDQVMRQIYSEQNYRKTVLDQLKKSLLCFLSAIGLGFGLAISMLIIEMDMGLNASIVKALILFVFGVVGMLYVENYYRLILRYST